MVRPIAIVCIQTESIVFLSQALPCAVRYILKCRDPGLNRSRQNPPESRLGRHFDRFPNVDSFRPETDSDFLYGVVVEPSGVKDLVNFDDSRSNRSRDIRLLHLVANSDE